MRVERGCGNVLLVYPSPIAKTRLSERISVGLMSADLRHRRILLKVSGEALMGAREYGLDPEMQARIADEIASVHALGVELCLVIGGGNIFRGVSGSAAGMERASADYMGMLATV